MYDGSICCIVRHEGILRIISISLLCVEYIVYIFLKNIPILDIMIQGINYLIRVLYGAALAEVPTSD